MTTPLWIAACFGSLIIGGVIGFILSALMTMAGDPEW